MDVWRSLPNPNQWQVTPGTARLLQHWRHHKFNSIRPASKHFTRGFLICASGLTIKDRLHALQQNDPNSYYKDRELVPGDMLDDVNRAKIVITNYHAFKMRERIDLSKGGRQLLQGRTGEEPKTLETEG